MFCYTELDAFKLLFFAFTANDLIVFGYSYFATHKLLRVLDGIFKDDLDGFVMVML